MKLFNQNAKIDLPDIRKKQTYRNKEVDDFDFLFKNNENKEADLIDLRKNKRLKKGYHFYIVMGFVLFIAACFLVVQMVVSSPEIEKYKTATKNIEEADSPSIYESDEPVVLSESKSPVNDVPDVQFAGNSVSKPVIKPAAVIKKINPAASKKVQIVQKLKIKTVIKPSHLIAHTVKNISIPKKNLIVKVISKPRIESKIEQAIADIMLRPLVLSNNLQNASGASLRGLR